MLFDLRRKTRWEDKIFLRQVEHAGKTLRVVGC